MLSTSQQYNKMMEQLKFNIVNMIAFITSMFLTNIESVLSIAVLLSALIFNLIKLYRQNK